MQTSENTAVIDIGTHSVLLLIARKSQSGRIEIVHQASAVGRLGAGLTLNGNIADREVNSVLAVLRDFSETAQRFRARSVHLMGTEVFRKASNGKQVADFFSRELRHPMKILSAEEEALFAFAGAVTGLPSREEPILLIDVGGGSTEFVLGKDRRVREWSSIPIGAFILAQNEHLRETLSPGLQEKLNLEIKQYLAKIPFSAGIKRHTVVIASGGTAGTLAALSLRMKEYDSKKVEGLVLPRNRIQQLFDRINALSADERRRLPGMEKGREDVILYGILIYLNTMNRFGLSALQLTDRGARFGYMSYVLNQGS